MYMIDCSPVIVVCGKTMYKLVILLAFVNFFTINVCHGTSLPVNRGYIFTAPKKLLAGETENACLSLHNLEPPVHILLELISPSSDSEEEILTNTSTVLKTGVETCLELSIPVVKYMNARLHLKMKFDKHPDYVVDAKEDVYIEHDSLITFVETDKPVYKPGQDVNIRVLMLKHDLKPWKKVIPKIWIENPSEVRVAQWTNVSLEHGMVQLQFALSPEPSPGTWKIKVEKKSYPQLIHTTNFEVKKYVLPRFQMTITSPGYILADAENVTWNICAKYSYGKPVKGTLLLKSTPQTPSWRRKQNLPEIHYETELDTPDGCTEFALSAAVLGLADWKVAPNNIVLIANFTETGTGIVETSISRTVVVHQALKLDFVPYTPKHFKLGLPYHGKLRVTRQDDTPAPNEKIQLCLRVRGRDEWLRVVVECRNFTSSVDGFVDFIVPPPHKNIVLLSFVATGINYPMKYYSPDKRWRVFMDQPSAYIEVNPWYSPSDSYLAVARSNQPIICGEKYSFNVMYTMPARNHSNDSIAFHYSINSKGDLLIFGHVKHKPHRDSILNYSEFRNLLGPVESPANKTEHNHVVHKFPLSVKVTPSMAPVSELLLYYVRPDGETVATSYTIEVGHCFENKVKTAWHTDVESPGSVTQYHIEAAPWSLCGVSAVDKSTLFLAGSKANLADADKTFDQLKRFHVVPENRPIWTWAHCKATPPPVTNIEEIDHLPSPAMESAPAWGFLRRRRSSMYDRGINYADSILAFDEFGVIVMTDLILETRPCPQFSTDANPWVNFGFDRVGMMRADVLDEPNILFRAKMMPMAYPLLNFQAQMTQDVGYVDQTADQTATLRSYFPETWLWELVPTGKEGKTSIERTVPHTITDWIGHTVCISPKHGLGIAPPTTITAFQPFFLDYNLPYSVKRGELLRLKVSLFNYMQHSLPVKIQLEDTTGFNLQSPHPSISFCVKPRDSIVHEYLLKPQVLGDVNITVSAAIDAEYVEPCGPETIIYTRDAIVKPILVLPEGFPMDLTKSAFICPKDFTDDSTIAWTLDLPKDLVPDSARGEVSLIGDILGPALENLDNLVRLPMGCGEQNMILFVPNIHAIGYLDVTGIENSQLRAKAIKNMKKGYQRELNYRHSDGSYSAFGTEGDSSMWLTAFVVKSLAQARTFIHIDEHDLKLSVKWIVKKQLENGCFPVIGRVFHKEMKGGLQEDDSSSSALTAYVLVALLESGVPLTASLINNALYCIEKGMSNTKDNPYATTLSVYALALLEHPKANASMTLLLDRANRQNDLLWWEDKSKSSIELTVEMTAYAVLSLVKLGGEGNMVEALKAIRWMSKQRNAEGGFTSTQDTVIGLEALTKYAIAMSTNKTDLSILVTAGEVDQVYKMDNDNRMVLSRIRLPTLPTVVEIFAEGEGCVLVQANLKYNVAHATGSDAFDLSVIATSVDYVDECSMQRITVCSRYKLADEESNMALLEIGMISGYVPDRTTLHSLLEDPSSIQFGNSIVERDFFHLLIIMETGEDVKVVQFGVRNTHVICESLLATYPVASLATMTRNFNAQFVIYKGVKRFEEDHGAVTIYFDKLVGQNTCISFLVTRENIVDRLAKANVKLYDYYQQELTTTSSYNFAQTCSSADTNEERTTSNPTPVELKLVKDTMLDGSSFDKLKIAQMDSGSGLAPEEANPNTFDNINIDELGIPVNLKPTTVEFKGTDVPEFGGNPSFVEVDHELEVPEGREGPYPVYIKPNTIDFNETDHQSKSTLDDETTITLPSIIIPLVNQEDNENPVIPLEEFPKEISTLNSTEPATTIPPRVTSHPKKHGCPICDDKLPSNFNDIFCSANDVVKVAIRRLRKARLLLDLKTSDAAKRLRSTLELALKPGCSCSPLDNPGGLALLINSGNKNFLIEGDSEKQTLDHSVSVYALPNRGGVPVQITEAKSSCSSSDNNPLTV